MRAWVLCSSFKSRTESQGKLHTNFDLKNRVNLSFLTKMHTENHVELDHCKRKKKKKIKSNTPIQNFPIFSVVLTATSPAYASCLPSRASTITYAPVPPLVAAGLEG